MVDGVLGEAPGHQRFWLPRGILIIEAMARLEMLPPRSFVFMAPLPIENGSGSPLRPLAFF
jgi:kynurenine formamidase